MWFGQRAPRESAEPPVPVSYRHDYQPAPTPYPRDLLGLRCLAMLVRVHGYRVAVTYENGQTCTFRRLPA